MNKTLRQRIFDVIEVGSKDDRAGQLYDIFMVLVIVVSILPLMTKTENRLTDAVDNFAVTVFIIDYVLRLITADLKLKKGIKSFFLYPFTFMAIVDLLAILPSITMAHRGFKLLKLARQLRSIRVLMVFKTFRYSKNINIIINVFKKQKDSLLVVCWLVAGYVVLTSLIMFNVEPETFDTFFDAVYWATISLMTVGYGDIYAVSTAGRVITMISAVFGTAIVALPAGIMAAGYMEEIDREADTDPKGDKEKENGQ